jgi:hypothetical protein
VLTIEGRFENDNATGDLDLLDDVTIIGVGVVVDAMQIDRVFDVHFGVSAAISFMTIRGGLAMVDEQDPEEQEGSGGGILIRDSAYLTLNGVVVTRNEVRDVTDDGFGDGAGLSNFGTTTIRYSSFRANIAENEGGGVESDGDTLEIWASQITGNQAGADGGGIQADDGASVRLTGVIVSGNQAGADGGGIQVEEESILTLRGTFVSQNVAAGRGGGVALDFESTASFVGTSMLRNQAGFEGGGLHVAPDSIATGFGTTVAANTPDNCVPAGVIPGCAP